MTNYKDMEVDVHSNKIVIWDLGPKKPGAPPPRPPVPKGEPNTPEYDLAQLDIQEVLEKYEADLLAYRALKKEYEEWHRRWGGPYEIYNVWHCDGYEMLAHGRCGKCLSCVQAPKNAAGGYVIRDQNGLPAPLPPCESPRYVVSASSPGLKHLKNRGLPEGIKPGRGQDEQIKRIAEGREMFLRQKQQDPVFGSEEMRA